MKTQTVLAALVAFAVAAVLGIRLGGSGGDVTSIESSAPPSTTTSTVPHAVFVSGGETVVGPVVVIAQEPHLDGNQLVVNFEIHGLAPLADAASVIQYAGFGSTQVVPPEELNTVFLDTWLVSTPTGDIPGTVANPAARAARFGVGEGFDIESVDEFTIASYSLLTPIDADIVLGPGMETAQVAPGLSARLLAITEQNNSIVQVELVSEGGDSLDTLAVNGAGPGWLSGVREAEGRPRWNLTYASPNTPSPIELNVTGAAWIEIDEQIPVTVGTSP